MKIVVFGLTMSSSWGNGHAKLWRGLCRALGAMGHRTTFFEKEVPFYAAHRDLERSDGCDLVMYRDWSEIARQARIAIREASVAIVTSYCPDARIASHEVLRAPCAVRGYYDLDTPVTLAALAAGEDVPHVPEGGLEKFDLVLSYSGGGALVELRRRLGAKVVFPLYGHVDPERHRPADPHPDYACDLSYLGTYAADRHAAMNELFLEPAAAFPERSFVLAGAQYPSDLPKRANVRHLDHVPPPAHPRFFASSRFTLNITRGPMARSGFCPSGRLFEAAACGVPVVTDSWEGIERFFAPGKEIIVARSAADVGAALQMSEAAREVIAAAARARVLREHTSAHRAVTFLRTVELARASRMGRGVQES